MLHLVTDLYNHLFVDPSYNVLIVGHESTGKTTLFEQLKWMYGDAKDTNTTDPVATRPWALDGTRSTSGNLDGDGPPSLVGSSTSLASGFLASLRSASQSNSYPAGTPHPSPLMPKRTRPTIGLNHALITHRFSSVAAILESVPTDTESLRDSVASLPPPAGSVSPSRYAIPSAARTQLTLWDVGGRPSLRSLWVNYFARCHAIIYVMDSTLLTTDDTVLHNTANRTVRDACPANHATLQQLLTHPDLQDTVFLLLCNKSESLSHAEIAQLQEDLGLADLALLQHGVLSASASSSDSPADRSTATSVVTGTMGGSSVSTNGYDAPLCGQSTANGEMVGFKLRPMTLLAISAMDGTGVAKAMDWLVRQLQHFAREVLAGV